jgi:hypothetical protein
MERIKVSGCKLEDISFEESARMKEGIIIKIDAPTHIIYKW